MIEFETLSDLLSASLGRVDLRTHSPDHAVVALPNLRQSHDQVVVSIERGEDGWTASDLGATAFLLGDEFDAVVDAMICAGAPFVEENGVLIARLDDRDATRTAEELSRFATNVSAAPLVWHSIACAMPRREQAPSTTSIMAREARGVILQAIPAADRFLALDVSVYGALEKVKAPLQFRTGSNRRPQILAGCIDFSAGAQSEAAAKKLTSYLWDTVSEIPSVQKYVIVRGSDQQVERVAHLYDSRNVTALPSDSLQPLTESVAELVGELLR